VRTEPQAASAFPRFGSTLVVEYQAPTAIARQGPPAVTLHAAQIVSRDCRYRLKQATNRTVRNYNTAGLVSVGAF
jgi:hypothetical protein